MSKSRTQRRMNLTVSAVLLLMAAVVLAGISYAWFTISTVPEVRAVLTNVTVNGNLEIALSAGTEKPVSTTIQDGDISDLKERNHTWGSIIDLNAETYSELAEVILRPVENTEDGGFSYPVYGSDGRIQRMEKLSIENGSETGITVVQDQDITYLYCVDLWMRSNTDGSVILVQEEGIEPSKGLPESEGKGSKFTIEGGNETLLQHLKIVFLDEQGGLYSKAVADENGNLTLDENSSSVLDIGGEQKDQPIFVRMCVFLDGMELKNADMKNAEKSLAGTLNIQFTLDTELEPMSQ